MSFNVKIPIKNRTKKHGQRPRLFISTSWHKLSWADSLTAKTVGHEQIKKSWAVATPRGPLACSCVLFQSLSCACLLQWNMKHSTTYQWYWPSGVLLPGTSENGLVYAAVIATPWLTLELLLIKNLKLDEHQTDCGWAARIRSFLLNNLSLEPFSALAEYMWGG